jgi:hypothetical protein
MTRLLDLLIELIMRIPPIGTVIARLDSLSDEDETDDCDVEPQPSSLTTAYVHLDWSGRIFVVCGDTGSSYWTDSQGLRDELDRLRAAEGILWYSCARPHEDPPQAVVENFQIMADAQLPIRLLFEPHPQAQLQPSEHEAAANPEAA